MKKYLLLGFISFSLLGLLTGCTNNKEDKSVTNKKETKTITWQTRRDMSNYQDYFNQVLKEKGYPYQVEFSTKEENKETDILDIGSVLAEETYNTTKEITDKKVIPLDSYFKTEEGNKLKATVPQNVWDAYKVNGKQYSVLNAGFLPTRTVYIWDKLLADKYQIHPETWTEELWKYKDELKKVYDGESKDNFLTTRAISALLYPPEYTLILGECYPLVINEKDESNNAQFLYDVPQFKEAIAGITSLYNSGIYSPEKEIEFTAPTVFLEVSQNFATKEAYAFLIGDEDFWETHEVKILNEQPLCKTTYGVVETGISSKCSYPEDAFRLLSAIYTDKDLSNALIWGEKDVQFCVNDNFAVLPNTTNRQPTSNEIGNMLIAYTEVGQDKNKETLYPKQIKNAVPSKLFGFNFVGKNCTKELENIFQVWYEDFNHLTTTPASTLLNQDNLYKKYKESGIDKVIAEWNREFQEWKNTQEAK